MFDVGFSELILLFVIGLLILGPERLPRVAAQLGRWMGKARRTAHQLRMQLEREMTMSDIMRDEKNRAQPTAKNAATDSTQSEVGTVKATESESESAESAETAPEDGYPPEEDANDSGHGDADGDVTPQSASTDTATTAEPANDADTAQQRRA